jgi:5-methylcytosine-specific restriction endonuclease McrA
MQESTCSVDGCAREANRKAKTLCEMHYYREYRWGDVNVVRKVVKYEDGTPCSLDSCSSPVFSLGYCRRHYAKFRKYGDATYSSPTMGPAPKPPTPCGIEGCDKPTHGRGICGAHYQRWLRHGDPTAWVKKIGRSEEARIESQRRFGRSLKGRLKGSRRRALMRGADVRQVTAKDWLSVVRRYRNCCAYCGSSDKPLTREHIIPLARGGRHSIGNLIPVCGSCNSSKADRLLVEWRRIKQSKSAA